jgi:hypothetical protein
VAIVKVYDRADEFRIQIAGRFAGECVEDIASTWKNALLEAGSRRFIIDISRLTSYDPAGRKLLSEMHQHGTQIAAGTPLSLVFLNEISAPPRRGPALVREGRPNRRQNEGSAPPPHPIAAGQ